MTELPKLKKRFRKDRKKPVYETICTCGAYSHPHRFGGGFCDGSAIVAFFWDNGMCGGCRYKDFDDWRGFLQCQVLNGREKIVECEQLQEFLRSNESFSKRLPKR